MAIGYILKPVSEREVLRCVNRVSKWNTVLGFDDIMVRYKGNEIFIKHCDILFIEAANNKCIINTYNKQYLVNRSMKSFLSELPSDMFLKSHRSFIVNISNIKCIESFNNSSYNIIFPDNSTALLCRTYLKTIRSKLKMKRIRSISKQK